MLVIKFLKKHLLFILFTIAYLTFSLLTYKDFGATYDERLEYSAGKMLVSYFLNPTSFSYVLDSVNNVPADFEGRHLPLVSVYSRVYPALLSLFNPNGYFEYFHFENMLFGYLLFLFAYILFYLFYKDQKKAIIAPLFLVLTPELFGHIPANPKDVPFASLYLLGVLTIYYFQTHKINKNLEILIVGLLFGLVSSQRTVGLTLYLAYAVSKLITLDNKLNFKVLVDTFLETLLVFCVSLISWILCLPFLGANLPANFIELLHNSAGYREWNNKIFYLGQSLTKDQRPWHYLFVYLGIKLPLFVPISLIAGTLFVLRKKIRYTLTHPIIMLLLLTLLNTALYLVLVPVVYNGTRHFFYLIVCIVLISGFLFIEIFQSLKPSIRKVAGFVFILYVLFTGARLINLHPYEYIYFNELVGGVKGASNYFDVEYWGASYKEGSEYVRKIAQKLGIDTLKVYSCDNQYVVNYYSQYKFVTLRNSTDAEFVICDIQKDRLRTGHDVTHPYVRSIKREDVPIFNIRASKTFVETYGQDLLIEP